MSMFDDAVQAIRMGDKEEGRRLLEEVLETDENNQEIWLWLTAVVDTDEDREVCLENVLALNPNNALAKRSLDALRSGNFNAGDIIRSAIQQEQEDTEEAEGASFIDEFRMADEPNEDEDDELVMPSTMAKTKKSKSAAKKKGGGFKPNPRLIVLAVLVLLIICALGGVAVYNLVGGDVEPSGGQVEPETPAGGGESQPATEPAASETPPETPTEAATPTKPSLELPTAKPTDAPTPTSTPVVLPTVGGSQ